MGRPRGGVGGPPPGAPEPRPPPRTAPPSCAQEGSPVQNRVGGALPCSGARGQPRLPAALCRGGLEGPLRPGCAAASRLVLRLCVARSVRTLTDPALRKDSFCICKTGSSKIGSWAWTTGMPPKESEVPRLEVRMRSLGSNPHFITHPAALGRWYCWRETIFRGGAGG